MSELEAGRHSGRVARSADGDIGGYHERKRSTTSLC
jgi:hypothetical protein